MRISVLVTALFAGVLLPGNVRCQSRRIHLSFSRQGSAIEPEFGQLAQLRPPGSYLGVRLLDLDADRAKALKLPEPRGVEVANVEEGSPAESAGIKKGDILLSYNGENILGAQHLIRLVQETPEGRKIKIQVWRDGKSETMSLVTGSPRSRLETPPNFFAFTIPDPGLPSFIPNPMLVWKNSLFGMECESVDSQLAQYFGVKRGVLVRSVDPGSAAEKAGLRAGDVLIAIGDRTVATPRDMTSYMRMEHEAGKPIALSLVRNRKPLTINLAAPEGQ